MQHGRGADTVPLDGGRKKAQNDGWPTANIYTLFYIDIIVYFFSRMNPWGTPVAEGMIAVVGIIVFFVSSALLASFVYPSTFPATAKWSPDILKLFPCFYRAQTYDNNNLSGTTPRAGWATASTGRASRRSSSPGETETLASERSSLERCGVVPPSGGGGGAAATRARGRGGYYGTVACLVIGSCMSRQKMAQVCRAFFFLFWSSQSVSTFDSPPPQGLLTAKP